MDDLNDSLDESLRRMNRPASLFHLDPAQIQEAKAAVRTAQYYGCWTAYCYWCEMLIGQNYIQTEADGPPTEFRGACPKCKNNHPTVVWKFAGKKKRQ